MPDAVETMMFLGQTPWHGKGISISEDDAYDIEKCIEYAGLNWEVEIEQCYIKTVDNFIENEYLVDAWATVRTSDSFVLGIVGERYEILQNKEAFKVFQPFLDTKLVKLNTAGSLYNGKKIWVLAEIISDPICINKDDYIRKFILLSHGHDGKSIIKFGLTPIRVVCANTLSMAYKASQLFKVKHTQKMYESINNIRDIIETINTDYNIAANHYKMINEFDIDENTLDSYIKEVFEINEEKISTRTYNLLERIKSYFYSAPGNQGQTLWDAYNAVTYYFSHIYGNNVDNRLSTLWFGKSAETNKRALNLALNMVDLDG